jgi:uncharacterized protein with GYD domain
MTALDAVLTGEKDMAWRLHRTIKFTEQNIQNIKMPASDPTLSRWRRRWASRYRTLLDAGPFDGLIVFDAPDEETATALMLQLGSLGNVHTQTARAYKAAEMEESWQS